MADVTIDYTNGIVLQVNEATRTITNGGKDIPIILGVKGDDCAERIYFEIPKQLSSSITDVTKHSDDESTIVYVNFKNAMHDTYIEECVLIQDDETKAVFYWEITNNATEAKGDVKFNICVKRFVKDAESGESILQNEWHTTMFTGKVLDSVDVSRTSPTPEIIVHDTITFQTLNEYAAAYNTWSETLADMNDFVSGEVDAEVAAKVVNYLPLAGGSMTGSINMANSNGLLFSNGSFTSDQNGHPIISSKNGAVLFIGDDEYIPSWFTFPNNGGGTLATKEDIDYKIDELKGEVYTTEVDGIVTAATKTSYFNGAIGLVDSSNKTYLLGLPLKSGTLALQIDDSSSLRHNSYAITGVYDGNNQETYRFTELYTDGIMVEKTVDDDGSEYFLKFPHKDGTLATEESVINKSKILFDCEEDSSKIISLSANKSTDTLASIEVALNESPKEGSKLRIHLATAYSTGSYPSYKPLVLEMIVENCFLSGNYLSGEVSHYLNINSAMFYGVLRLSCEDDSLFINIKTDKYIEALKSVGVSLLKVEMITGPNI